MSGTYGDVEETVLYGVFNTPPNSIGGSAVCSFRLADISSAFEGQFKEQRNTGDNWLAVDPHRVPSPRPGKSPPWVFGLYPIKYQNLRIPALRVFVSVTKIWLISPLSAFLKYGQLDFSKPTESDHTWLWDFFILVKIFFWKFGKCSDCGVPKVSMYVQKQCSLLTLRPIHDVWRLKCPDLKVWPTYFTDR